MSGRSFSGGIGRWTGAAEVYDAQGRFAGLGIDTRSVQADDQAGTVTVEATFDGPFKLSGAYTIVDHGKYRTYEGPLNIGYAEALGDGLVAAHNYWPDLGLSQRFFLMVMPDGTQQLSLALLSRGEKLHWTVVGEYHRQSGPSVPVAPPPEAMDPAESGDDPAAGRGELLLMRPGRWSGQLHHLDADLEPRQAAGFTESVTADGGDCEVEMSGLGFAEDVSFPLSCDGWSVWTPTDNGSGTGSRGIGSRGIGSRGTVSGSATLSGGRGLSGQFHHRDSGLRVWRREAAALDGSVKAVLWIWYRGEQRVGATHGTLAFDPT